MGIRGPLIKCLKEDEKCQSSDVFITSVHSLRKPVQIEDGLCRLMRRLRTMNTYRRVMSGRELFQAWVRPIDDAFRTRGFWHYVVLIDDPSRVPSQKHEEWLERDRSSKGATKKKKTKEGKDEEKKKKEKPMKPKVNPYDAGATFDMEGIKEPGRANRLIDLDRVAVTRSLRRPLLEFLHQCLRTYTFPVGVAVYFDYDSAGPWRYLNGKTTRMTELRHPFGEADLSLGLWARYFRKTSDVIVESEDSDVIMILLNYVETTKSDPNSRHILLQRPDEFIDIMNGHKAIGTRLLALNVAVIATVTDFFRPRHKAKLLPRIGNYHIIKWALSGKCRFRSFNGWNLRELLVSVPNLWGAPLGHPALLPPPSATLPSTAVIGRKRKGFSGDDLDDDDLLWHEDTPDAAAAMLLEIMTEIHKHYHARKGKHGIYYSNFTIASARALAWNLQYWLPFWHAILVHV